MRGKRLLAMRPALKQIRMFELMTDKEHSDLALARFEKEVADLKKDKESSNLTAKKSEKEVAELKRREPHQEANP